MPLPATLTYNGVDLIIGRVLQCLQETEYDDVNTALWTNFDLTVRCIVNPYGTASNKGAVFGGVPGLDAPGDFPGASIANLRRSLLQPRARLVVRVGNDVVWEAPQTTTAGVLLPCDATGGPTPVAFNVEGVIGAKSIIAVYRIRFALVECVSLGGSVLTTAPGGGPLPPPILLSHVWDMEETLDEQALSTRVITGEAIFRRDFLEARLPDLTADDFRPQLRHPIPSRYQRLPVRVKATRDGQGVQYQITDVEKPWGIVPDAGILRIEGRVFRSYDWIGLVNPVMEAGVEIQAWGQPKCTSQTLARALVAVASTMRNTQGKKVLGDKAAGVLNKRHFNACRVEVHFPRRYATLTLRQRASGAVLGGLAMFGSDGVSATDRFAEDFGDVGGPAQAVNPALANDALLRGDRLTRLVTQALAAPCSGPAPPPEPGQPYFYPGT